MAKQKLDGVEITNLVFIVLALALGVTSYFLFNNVAEKKQEIAAAQAETSAMKSEVSNMTSDFTKLKTKLGYQDVADTKQLQETMDTDVANALGKTEKNSTYRDIVVALGKNLAEKNAELKENYAAQRLVAENVSLSEKNKTTAQADKFQEQETTLDTDHSDAIALASKSKNDLNASFQEQTKELDDLKSKTKKEIELAKQDTADFKELKEKFAKENAGLSRRVDELANATYERADAEILYADQVLKLVRLNVGERDGVRPLTTFNVFEPNALDMNDSTAKGSVQVVRNLGEHMCEAKILEDQMSNPVKQGDLVYTPLWRPSDVIKYALDYRLDINGDGFSDLNELITLIQSSGAEVAAYINDDGQVMGNIGPDVYRVVVGDRSVTELLAKDYVLDDATKETISNNQQKFLSDLAKMGVEQLELKDFLEKIGYKETAGISRYREEGGVTLQENGVPRQIVSPGIIAPTYVEGADKPQVSPGITAPIYNKDADRPEVSLGVVSDYYNRKRADKK